MMTETVTIPKVEYQRLYILEEDLADIRAASVDHSADLGADSSRPRLGWDVGAWGENGSATALAARSFLPRTPP